MELTPEERKRIYEEEKERDNARTKIEAEKKAQKSKGGRIGCLVIIGLVFVMWLIGTLIGNKDNAGKPSTNLSTGSQARLYVNGLSSIFVAVDKESFDELTKASVANDKIGMANMLFAERIFEVRNDVKVLIIDNGVFKRKVRILEGKQTGRSGWVPSEWVN